MSKWIDNGGVYKYGGVLWVVVDPGGDRAPFLSQDPRCPAEGCRVALETVVGGDRFYCSFCERFFPIPGDRHKMQRDATRKWEGHLIAGIPVHSLDLPPTRIKDVAEDENYWVEAKLSERNGKRAAVVYFGERVKGEQAKTDYVQVFLDFEDEQLRFDKNNKNPMKLLGKLTAEFPASITSAERRSEDGEVNR